MFSRRYASRLDEALKAREQMIKVRQKFDDANARFEARWCRPPTPQETAGWTRARANAQTYTSYTQPTRVNTVDTNWLLTSSSSCSDYSPSYASEPSSSHSSSSCLSSSESSSADSGSCGGSE